MAADRGSDDRRAWTAAALRTLAALAPDRRVPTTDVRRTGTSAEMAWLGTFPTPTSTGDPTTLFVPETGRGATVPGVLLPGATDPSAAGPFPESAYRRLARHDALTPDVDDLRLGWLWAVGEVETLGATRTVAHPLLSRRVHLALNPVSSVLVPTGPWDLWPLVTDAARGERLEQTAQFGGGALDRTSTQALLDRLDRLRSWADDVLRASDLPPAGRVLIPADPRRVDVPKGKLSVHAGYGIFVADVLDVGHPQETLTAWSHDSWAHATAFASAYLGPPAGSATWSGAAPVPPTVVVNQRQAEVVRRSRVEPVTAVSGPPGTGKSHVAAAVALDAVARGESVLLATRSAVAADRLAELLADLPGPDPVRFGSGEIARSLADRLADGLTATPGPDLRVAAEAHRRFGELHDAQVATLDAHLAAERWTELALVAPARAAVAPRLFPAADPNVLAHAVELLGQARHPDDHLLAKRRRHQTEEALAEAIGAPAGTSLDAMADAVELADLRRRALALDPRDAATRAARWDALDRADLDRRRVNATTLAAALAARADESARRSVAALATALRAGRAVRRHHLSLVDVRSLTAALPLWIGTLGEIESLLPPVAGAFGLVVLDEASQIDQLAASAALLRARRAVVIGDPRQLRFVSFTADAEVRSAIAANRCGGIADRLDVRRVSAFDLAAGAAPVTLLDEHYRSAPHLIGFSAHRFYDDRLRIATRHPSNDRATAIDVRRLDGDRDRGVNRAEVEAALAEVETTLAADDHATVGVVTPYRAQADALRAAAGERVPLDALASGRVRVGTVHEFQGAECDVVVASFAVGGATDRGRGFLEDPNLFNVLVTRARRRLVVLLSGEPPATGLLAEYLRWATTPPTPPAGRDPQDPWTRKLATVLHDAHAHVRTGYPVGRWELDLVVGEGAAAVGVLTRVHPSGVEAHLARHLALRRAGWTLAECFEADHDGDAVAAALALAPR